MSDLDQQFDQASRDVKTLSSRPSNDDLLALYALFKQATEGDVTGKRPGFTDFKGRAKFDAWGQRRGMGSDDAKQAYVDLVARLMA